MYCLKCGKDTNGSGVFCDRCLQTMERHPVKPGTVIQLPHRKTAAPVKKSRKRALSPEELIDQLRQQKRGLVAAVALLIVLLGLTSGLLAYQLTKPPEKPQIVGRNYTIDTTGRP